MVQKQVKNKEFNQALCLKSIPWTHQPTITVILFILCSISWNFEVSHSLQVRSTTSKRSTNLPNICTSYYISVKEKQNQCYGIKSELFASNFSLEPENKHTPIPLPKLQYKSTSPKSKPKPVLVLGATGRIGRLVVQQLLQYNIKVRAFVRDYDLACEIFSKYLDSDYENPSNNSNGKGKRMELVSVRGRNAAGSGDLLQIVQGDVAPEDVDFSEDDDIGYEALESAIKGCDTIISCTGTIRPSKLSDYFPPTRLWNKDVKKWCEDRRHPYYVNYLGVKKLMDIVKMEVERRERLREDARENQKRAGFSMDSSVSNDETDNVTIVRISDLYVAFPPWSFITILINLARSMVFRYQEMAEQVLIKESSSKIRTIILRPGDLIDDDRDPSIANLQIEPSGILPSPSIVSRSDVAALAVASVLASNENLNQSLNRSKTQTKRSLTSCSTKSSQKSSKKSLPSSLTLALRWVGEEMYPQSQGTKELGFKDAETCMKMLQQSDGEYIDNVTQNNSWKKYSSSIIPFSLRKGNVQNYALYASLVFYGGVALFSRVIVYLLWDKVKKLCLSAFPLFHRLIKMMV